MKTVGLTGGIGSGKSLVAKVFQVLGVPVYSADAAGRRLLNENKDVRRRVIEIFGNKAYIGNHADRAYIANEVFSDQSKLDSLNQIIHPAVKEDFQLWKEGQFEKGKLVCIRESAILFESKTHLDCDLIIAVAAQEKIRIDRVKKRDGVSESNVRSRMAKQMDQESVLDQSDVCIDNSGKVAVLPQIIAVYQTYLV